jgi:hypothetical protein
MEVGGLGWPARVGLRRLVWMVRLGGPLRAGLGGLGGWLGWAVPGRLGQMWCGATDGEGPPNLSPPPKPPRLNAGGPARLSAPPNGSGTGTLRLPRAGGQAALAEALRLPRSSPSAPLVQLFLLFPDPGCSCGWFCLSRYSFPP